MFNNGKFKNVVADSDSLTPSPVDQHVAPGTTLNTSVILRPQRGPTKNWIALEDTLQRSTEPRRDYCHDKKGSLSEVLRKEITPHLVRNGCCQSKKLV